MSAQKEPAHAVRHHANIHSSKPLPPRNRLRAALRAFVFVLLGLGAIPAHAIEVAYFNTDTDAEAGCEARRQAFAAATTNWLFSCSWIAGADPKYVQVPSNTWAIRATPNNLCQLGMCPADEWVWAGFYPVTACSSDQTFTSPGVCEGPDDSNVCMGCPNTAHPGAPNRNGGWDRGNPSNATTGNKHQSEEDYRSGDGSVILSRHYNSLLASQDGGFGYGWSAIIHRRLEFNAARIVAREASGRGEPFTEVAGNWQGKADTTLTLVQDATGYTLSRRDGSSERYDTAGKLVSETTVAGKTTSYSYNGSGLVSSVTGPYGHALTFTYNGNRIASATDSANKIYAYEYDASGNLTRVVYPDNTARRYHYENTSFPHHLTGISTENATGVVLRFATYGYHTDGKAAVSEHALTDNAAAQEKTTFLYDGNQTTVTDAVGVAEVITFSANLGMRRITNSLLTSDNKSLSQTFDASNNLTCREDEEGRVTTYTYNATHQKTTETEGQIGTCASPQSTAATRTTTYQYQSTTSSLVSAITSPSVAVGQNKTTTIQYTDAAHSSLPTVITQAGFQPNATAVSRTVTLGYNANGQVNAIDGPRTDVNDVTTLTYYNCTSGNACGQLATMTNAVGHVTTFNTYNAAGRLTQSTDPNGLSSTYSYDDRGRLATLTLTPPTGGARVTQYTYDPHNGKVATVTFPDGRVLTHTYDAAHYLKTITDNLGNQIAYTYDLRGNRVAEKTHDPNQTLVRLVQRSYDTRNRISVINQAGSLTTQLRDAIGNLTEETDPNNTAGGYPIRVTHQYDALNRLIKTIDRLDAPAEYAYDVNDRLKQVTAPNGLATGYVYDDLGNLLQEQSPQRGTRTYAYDSGGNMTGATDGRGVALAYFYDALNRVIGIDAPGTNEDIAYTYDTCTYGKGRLCQVTDGSGTTTFTYNAFGNVVTHTKVEAGVTYVTSYTYDAADRVLTATYPDNRVITYTRDAVGNITGISQTIGGTATALLSGVQYRADGLIKSQTHGNGLTETRTINTKGQLTALSVGSITQSFGYDPNGNLTSTTNSTNTFDVLDRLASSAWSGGSNDYTYEGNGDLLLASVNTTTGPATEAYTYTSDGHLSAYSQNGSVVGSYVYNYQRQRTRKTASGVTTVYHYDQYGNLIQETTTAGVPIRTYVWLEYTPIAQIDRNGSTETITYLHVDHLNTPRWGTDSTGAVVWNWEGDPFGATPPIGTVTVNLRFPGQYADGESGLYYNWNRYYDPKLGRYITSDPIGLGGGLNTYAYVRNNPLRWIDPEGLMACKGQWFRYKWVRGGPLVPGPTGEGSGPTAKHRSFPAWTCTCYWLCQECEAPNAFDPTRYFDLPSTKGFMFFDGGSGGGGGGGGSRDGSVASGNNCLCPKPGPEQECKPCDQGNKK